jgi:parvulin-like peptidyl-prolyl isomerase
MAFGMSVAGCESLTAPVSERGLGKAAATAEPGGAEPAAAEPANIEAAHILIAYQGARARGTREKAEARKVAEGLAGRARKGEDFAALAREFSDDSGSKVNGGSLGSFTKDAMVAPFSKAAFALRVGQVSDVVETEFGFHVIKRTK